MTTANIQLSNMEMNDIQPASFGKNSFLNSSYTCFVGLNILNNEGFDYVACRKPSQENHCKFLLKKLLFLQYNYIFITSNIKEISQKII